MSFTEEDYKRIHDTLPGKVFFKGFLTIYNSPKRVQIVESYFNQISVYNIFPKDMKRYLKDPLSFFESYQARITSTSPTL